jgi:hypothetical protein
VEIKALSRKFRLQFDEIAPQILLLQPATAQPPLVLAERLADFAQRFAEGEVPLPEGGNQSAVAQISSAVR